MTGNRFSKTLLIFIVFVIYSCNILNRNESANKEAIAKAFNYYLYPEDLIGVVPLGTSRVDSTAIVKNYIENWTRRKAVLHKAEKNLEEEKKNVSHQLEEYRNSLITYAYETELIRQNLDTIVGEEEILAFYQSHQQNFELKDNIIKVIYLKLSKKSPKLDKVKEWYQSNSKKDRELLEEYCHQYAINYYLDDQTWLLFDDLLKEIPIKTYDKEQFLQNNRNIEIEDSSLIYLVNIMGFMIKNSISPLDFERKNIMSMIMNERKLKLINEMEQQAFQEAKQNGDLIVY
jgi:hypothetical protein